MTAPKVTHPRARRSRSIPGPTPAWVADPSQLPKSPPRAIREREPDGREWTQGPRHLFRGEDHGGVWVSGPILVISQLRNMDLPGPRGGVGPTWHVSISASGKRPKATHVRRALRAFGMTEAEEDNHSSGVARHYFMPVDPALRGLCECKTTEEQVTEPDGYRFSRLTGGTR